MTTASYPADLAALVDLVKRYGSMVALVNVSPKPWVIERQATADEMLRQIIEAVTAAHERAELAEENLSAALMQRDQETERADRVEALLSTLKLDHDLDDAYRQRG